MSTKLQAKIFPAAEAEAGDGRGAERAEIARRVRIALAARFRGQKYEAAVAEIAGVLGCDRKTARNMLAGKPHALGGVFLKRMGEAWGAGLVAFVLGLVPDAPVSRLADLESELTRIGGGE